MENKEQIFAGLGQVNGVGGAAAASVTPAMVDRLAVMSERAATALDTLTSPEFMTLMEQLRRSAPALTRTMQRVENLELTGSLDTILDLVELAHAARVSMTDEMIARLSATARTSLEMVDLALVAGLPDKWPALLNAAAEASEDADADQSRMGPLDLLRALKKPEMQFLVKFMLGMARRMPGALQNR